MSQQVIRTIVAVVVAGLGTPGLAQTGGRGANRLTDAEKQAGWTLLFDGSSMTGWRGYKRQDSSGTRWKVENGMLSVDPGVYRLIVSLADSEGRVGSVSRAVTAWAMEANALTLGDLLVGGLSGDDKAALSPAIEPAM